MPAGGIASHASSSITRQEQKEFENADGEDGPFLRLQAFLARLTGCSAREDDPADMSWN
jgi:hypothetical protein